MENGIYYLTDKFESTSKLGFLYSLGSLSKNFSEGWYIIESSNNLDDDSSTQSWTTNINTGKVTLMSSWVVALLNKTHEIKSAKNAGRNL